MSANANVSELENLLPYLRPDDGKAHLFHGSCAALQPLRSFQSQHLKVQTLPEQEQQDDNNNDEAIEKLLYHLNSAFITVTLPAVSNAVATKIQAQVLITTKRMLLVAHNEAQAQFDISMNAYSISLHALMSEPTRSLYCQLSDDVELHGDDNANAADANDEADSEMIFSKEITIEPNDEKNSQVVCQELFDVLSKLMNLNPMEDEDEMGSGGGGGGLAAMLGLMAGAYEDDESDDEGGNSDNDNDMIVRIDPSQFITADTIRMNEEGIAGNNTLSSPAATDRQKMLERLDNVLIVPPEYEVEEGQFDDADEDGLDSRDEEIL